MTKIWTLVTVENLTKPTGLSDDESASWDLMLAQMQATATQEVKIY